MNTPPVIPIYADSEAVRAAILKELDGLTKSELLFALDGIRNIKANRQKFAARA